MTRKYIKTSLRQSWSIENMVHAMKEVTAGHMGCRRASILFDVPNSTLQNKVSKVRKGQTLEEACTKVLAGKSTYKGTFSPDQEKKLVDHILLLKNRFFYTSVLDIRCLAYEFADCNNVVHSFNKVNKMAGTDWVASFMRRHSSLSYLIKRTTTCKMNKMNSNRQDVNKFFYFLKFLFQKHNFEPNEIYNLGEIGILTGPNKISEIITLQGKKNIFSKYAKYGHLVTSICCMNAAGKFMPAMFIFPGEKENPSLMDGAPPGSFAEYYPNGWMQCETFVKWFHQFIEFSKPTAIKPVVLLIHGCTTHVKSLEIMSLAYQNHIYLVGFPLQILKPIEAFITPLSMYYKKEAKDWVDSHPGQFVTIYQLAKLFCVAFKKSALEKNAILGFEKSGIVPLDRSFFLDYLFVSSENDDSDEGSVSHEVFYIKETLETEKSAVNDISLSPTQLFYECPNPSSLSDSSHLSTDISTEVQFMISRSQSTSSSLFTADSAYREDRNLLFNFTSSNTKDLCVKENLPQITKKDRVVVNIKRRKHKTVNSSLNLNRIKQHKRTEDILRGSSVNKTILAPQTGENCSNKSVSCSELIGGDCRIPGTDVSDVSQVNTSDLLPPIDGEYNGPQVKEEEELLLEDYEIKEEPMEFEINDMCTTEYAEEAHNDENLKGNDPCKSFETVFCDILPTEIKKEVTEPVGEEEFVLSGNLNIAVQKELNFNEEIVKQDKFERFHFVSKEVEPSNATTRESENSDSINNLPKEDRVQGVTQSLSSCDGSIVEGPNKQQIQVKHFSSSNLPVLYTTRPSNMASATPSNTNISADDEDSYFKSLKNILQNIPLERRSGTKIKIMELVTAISSRDIDPSAVIIAFNCN